jgi:hypothetical protein
LRDELVNMRRDKFFGAYMQKAKQGLRITTREDTARPHPSDPSRGSKVQSVQPLNLLNLLNF